ncbi:class I SAM-dependent methyltransferase [Gammaproteobacteria bacterium]|nr:class I SAM-dependent methyltransferase [Gammaproteobacteria bacterium]
MLAMLNFIPLLKEITSSTWLIEKPLNEATQKILTSTIKDNSRWLDIGCGLKPYAESFSNAHYFGIDIEDSGRPIDMKVPDKFYDGINIPYEDGSFDGLLCTQVLEHVEDMDKFLAECNRVVKVGGSFIISVPFIYKEHEKPYDFRRFTSYGLTSDLNRHGFQISKCLKLISSIETIAMMLCIYVDNNIGVKGRIARILSKLFIIFPTMILAKCLVKVLPDNRDLYLVLLASALKEKTSL